MKEVILLQDIICGACAQKTKLPLEERVNIALSIRRGESYLCKICLTIKLLPLNRNQDQAVTIEEEVPETPFVSSSREHRISSQIIEQIRLFD